MKTIDTSITMPRKAIILLMLAVGSFSLIGAGAAMPPIQTLAISR